VLTHGNGPQVGLLALQNAAYTEVPSYPLDVLDAETEGMVGYMLEQELGRHLPPDRLATLLTQVVVDPDDPAFGHPTKPVGPLYDRMEAERLAHRLGWSIARDGKAWRRVVPSPRPLSIVELPTIRVLVDHGVTVICAGGGGIPVVPTPAGHLCGVEAVVDKDLAAARLAVELDADALLLLTDVDAVYTGWGTPTARPVHDTTVDAPCPSLPGRWAPRSRPSACSWNRAAGWAPSARCPTPRPSSGARPAPESGVTPLGTTTGPTCGAAQRNQQESAHRGCHPNGERGRATPAHHPPDDHLQARSEAVTPRR
jgi:carbamate kinase